MPDYPKRGRGKRHLDCEVYGACLDLAAVERWEDFNCEGCPEFEEEQIMSPASIEDKKPAKLCEICKAKPTIHPNSPWCASCMAKRSHKSKGGASEGKAKKAPPKQPPRTGVKDYIDRMEAGAGPILTVHFDKHEDILEQVERLAVEQVRSLELQIIYMLKEHLNAVQKGVDVG